MLSLRFRVSLLASLISIVWLPHQLLPISSRADLANPRSLASFEARELNDIVDVNEDKLNRVIKETYLWSWPMVHLHNMRKPLRLISRFGVSGGVRVAPINQICMLTDLISPDMHSIPCPNRDVVYGFGMLDLTTTAVVIQVPDFGDRLWVYQLGDQRTEAFAQLGSMHGSQPGFYLAVGPNWSGTCPDGIRQVFRSPTNLAYLIPRVAVDDSPEDLQRVQSVLPNIVSYPLERFNGKPKQQDWTKRKWYPSIGSSSSTQCKWVKPSSFFDDLKCVLDDLTPLEHERAIYEEAKQLLELAQEHPETRKRLDSMANQLEQSLVTPLFHFRNFGRELPYNWTTVDNGANFGSDYFSRTAVARSNIFVNQPSEAKYFHTDQCAAGELLDGDHQYRIRIAPSDIPPNHGFWSLTLYDANHHLFSNPWNRFAIGSTDQLHTEEDGSIQIVIGGPPRETHSTNWLPAPKTNFSLYLRVYAPDPTVVNGEWTPPAVVREANHDQMASR